MHNATSGICTPAGEVYLENDAEAVKWYLKAAKQGNAKSQFNLGAMYENGKGVSKNDAEAARWYRRATEQGLAEAQYNLGVLYDNGRGCTRG